jgi:hypothetical protein
LTFADGEYAEVERAIGARLSALVSHPSFGAIGGAFMLSVERAVASVLSKCVVALVLLIAARTATDAAQNASVAKSGLTIVVIEGEDAINIIQQKTAVAPIVEIRDRNNQPVAGATVRFAIQGGRATFNGARMITLTTDAAGRAAVTGLTPTGSGAFQITASATFQGQTAVATISQTNVLTAAQASSAASTAGATGGAGGLSATTIAIVAGGAVAGGALIATQVGGAQGGVAIYEGDFRIDTLLTVQQAQPNGVISLTCTASLSQTGELRGEIDEREDGTVTGTISAKWSVIQLSTTCPFSSAASDVSYGKAPVTGTTAGFQASSQAPSDGVGFGAQSFSGTLTNGVIRGTWTLGPSGYRGANGFGGASSPAGSVQVTLTK